MNKEELKTAVKHCYDNNIIVYDNQSPGLISWRLLNLLLYNFEQHNEKTPTWFLMSGDARFQLAELFSKISETHPTFEIFKWFYDRCRDIEMNELTSCFTDELKAFLPYGDENIVLAICEPITNKSVMMGSY